jgi:GT2 family glycosyltransferase
VRFPSSQKASIGVMGMAASARLTAEDPSTNGVAVGLEPVTVIYVAYGTNSLDTAWTQPDDAVVIVHNDDALDPASVAHSRVRHLRPTRNIGFGAAVNLALECVQTPRLILCNPDTLLSGVHRVALASDQPDHLITIPLNDERGEATWVVQPYPSCTAALAMGYRLGRHLQRTSRLRALGSLLTNSRRVRSEALLGIGEGDWSLSTHWASAAVVSVDAQRLRDVGGFDPRYFLYMEDVDLCQRLAERFPEMRVRVSPCPAGTHAVGGSSGVALRNRVELHRLRSLRRYCLSRPGFGWRVAGALTAPRERWLAWRVSGGGDGG